MRGYGIELYPSNGTGLGSKPPSQSQALSQHDGCQIRRGRRNFGNDRRVNDSQALDAVNSGCRVNDSDNISVTRHRRGRSTVMVGIEIGLYRDRQRVIIRGIDTGRQFAFNQIGQRSGSGNVSGELHSGDETAAIGRIGQYIVIDPRRYAWIAALESHIAYRTWCSDCCCKRKDTASWTGLGIFRIRCRDLDIQLAVARL